MHLVDGVCVRDVVLLPGRVTVPVTRQVYRYHMTVSGQLLIYMNIILIINHMYNNQVC